MGKITLILHFKWADDPSTQVAEWDAGEDDNFPIEKATIFFTSNFIKWANTNLTNLPKISFIDYCRYYISFDNKSDIKKFIDYYFTDIQD